MLSMFVNGMVETVAKVSSSFIKKTLSWMGADDDIASAFYLRSLTLKREVNPLSVQAANLPK